MDALIAIKRFCEQTIASNSKNLLVCDFDGCGKGFLFTSRLERHKETHDAIRPKAQCSSCGKAFVNLSLHDCTKKVVSKPGKSLSRFYCPFCIKHDINSVDEVLSHCWIVG